VGKPEGKRPLGRKGVDGTLGLEWILESCARGVERIQLAQDRDLWRAVVNTVMYLQVLAPRS
jgi:hypothetical protein